MTRIQNNHDSKNLRDYMVGGGQRASRRVQDFYARFLRRRQRCNADEEVNPSGEGCSHESTVLDGTNVTDTEQSRHQSSG